MATISTLSSEVTNRLGSRTDLASRSYQWLRDALLELTSNYDIEELEVTGTSTALTASTAEYNISDFILSASSDTVQTIVDFRIYTDYSTNTVLAQLRNSHIQEIDKISQSVEGRPVKWARWGSKVIFSPTPDVAYSVIMRYRERHTLESTIENTTILLPPEWEHPLVMLATAYGHDELKEHDRAAQIYTHIYGGRDPATGIDKPGIIAKRLTKREREQGQQEWSLRPVVRATKGW